MSTRRNSRLRREYLFRKSLEGKERAIYEKKQTLKKALESGKAVPTELKNEAFELKQQLQYDDDATSEHRTTIDDEYARAGIEDPKILVTTSRDPSSRLTQFSKELRLLFPGSQRMNRGNTQIKQLVDAAKQHNFNDLIIVHEHRGEPDGLIVCHLPFGPTAFFGLSQVVLRHDLKDKDMLANVSEAFPHLIFDNFSTKLGVRLKTILRYLFPVPKEDSKRVITFANKNDVISFRHHIYKVTKTSDNESKQSNANPNNPSNIDLSEIGPRFEMKPYQILLGTIDQQQDADKEWVFRPFMNSTKNKSAI